MTIDLKIYGIGGVIISADASHTAPLTFPNCIMRYEPSQSRRRISLFMGASLPTAHLKKLYKEGAATPSLF